MLGRRGGGSGRAASLRQIESDVAQALEAARAERAARDQRLLQESLARAMRAYGVRGEVRPDACARALSLLPRLKLLLERHDAAEALEVLRGMAKALKS